MSVVQVCLPMARAIHQKLTAKHGQEVADRIIGMSVQAAIAHKDNIEKRGRFPHRCVCSSCRPV